MKNKGFITWTERTPHKKKIKQIKKTILCPQSGFSFGLEVGRWFQELLHIQKVLVHSGPRNGKQGCDSATLDIPLQTYQETGKNVERETK